MCLCARVCVVLCWSVHMCVQWRKEIEVLYLNLRYPALSGLDPLGDE